MNLIHVLVNFDGENKTNFKKIEKTFQIKNIFCIHQ